jgi:hypothetical protein
LLDADEFSLDGLVLVGSEVPLGGDVLSAEVEIVVGVEPGEVSTMVLVMIIVVTSESVDDSASELDCRWVVSKTVVLDPTGFCVIVALLNCRLTWRGK